jgi:hypothetical protein
MQLNLPNSGSIHEEESRRHVTHNRVSVSTKEDLTGFIRKDTRMGDAVSVSTLKRAPMTFQPSGEHCGG